MTLTASLSNRLAGFTGKEMSLLGETEAEFSSEPGYLDTLISLSSSEHSSGATWLLKFWCESGHPVSEAQTDALITHLGSREDWPTQLHLCQLSSFLNLEEANARRLGNWAAGLIQHKRPFVRAWALNALCISAGTATALLPQARRALKVASEDQAASVKARARSILKQYKSLFEP